MQQTLLQGAFSGASHAADAPLTLYGKPQQEPSLVPSSHLLPEKIPSVCLFPPSPTLPTPGPFLVPSCPHLCLKPNMKHFHALIWELGRCYLVLVKLW